MKKENTDSGADASDIEFDKDEEIQYSEDAENVSLHLQKIKTKLNTCLLERSEYLDGWQRAKADLANARKNFDAERNKMMGSATESVVTEIFPVVDSFEMAFGNKTAWEAVDKNWRIGVEYIYNKLVKILQDHDVIQFNPIGEAFDPALHTAIGTVLTNDASKADYIVEVIARGYKMRERVIRTAQVKTAHYEHTN